MNYEFSSYVDRLTEVCRTEFGDESRWFDPKGYRDALALCIIDSIYSTGSHYKSVINVVNEYWSYRVTQGADPSRDGAQELSATFEEVGGSEQWAALVDNRKPAHTSAGAPLKAEVVRQAAIALREIGILTTQDLRDEYEKDETLSRVKSVWLKLPSQSSGITFNYLLILAGLQSVKADRMILRFIQQHTDLGRSEISPHQAATLIKRVADAYPTTARKLDHVIWRHTSGREHLRPETVDVG
ncbi:heme peroxidase [Arthrobacter parietis]|uniref:Heme peroxidase n=1 Tax=Arthrobacter parietis TaxID=271434 RepID=A0ABN3AZF4_9MICC